MVIFGIIYTIIGMVYFKSDVLWGALVIVIGAVYLFGLERYGEDEERHILAHIIVGGMIGGFSGFFLLLEILVKGFENGFRIELLDLLFLITSTVSSYTAFKFSRKFS